MALSRSAAVLGRRLSSSAAAVPAAAASAVDSALQTSTLANGVTVASVDNAARATASLRVVVGAGSRHETTPTLGASHTLRACAFQDTAAKTGFRITREAEAHGVDFSATSTRESITYAAEAVRGAGAGAPAFAAEVLGLTVASPELSHWVVSDQTPRIQADAGAAASDAAFSSIDMLHKLAFKGGLSNSLTCPQAKIGAVGPAVLEGYHASLFTGGNISVYGYGISHEELCALAEAGLGGLPAGSPSVAASTFKGAGREMHHETGGSNTYMAFGFEGVSASSGDAAAVSVLKSLLASPAATSATSFTGNSHSLIGANLSGAAEGFSVGYADTGLFGVFVSSSAEESGAAYEAVLSGIAAAKSGSFSEAAVDKARNIAKLSALDDSAEGVIANIASGKTFEDTGAAYDAVTVDSVKAAAAKYLAASPAVVITGATTSL